MKTNSVFSLGLASSIAMLMNVPVMAGSVPALTIFTTGTPAKAAEVNSNFSAVKSAVEDNAKRITSLESSSVNTTGNLVLGASAASTGNILKGTVKFIHNFGTDNTFIGLDAGNFTMTGDSNTANGSYALQSNTTGFSNTAVGAAALPNNMTGDSNTAVGTSALSSNTTGIQNTAEGRTALAKNTAGNGNTASGVSALYNNTIGNYNTSNGHTALSNNTTGYSNTASGYRALESNTVGYENTAIGVDALRSNLGTANTAIGSNALLKNRTGLLNVAIGYHAMYDAVDGNSNIAIGDRAGSGFNGGGDYNIFIGSDGVSNRSGLIWIGNDFGTGNGDTRIAGIRATNVGGGVPVVISGSGQLGTISSSRRVKDDITDMGDLTSTLMKLRPVTFHYKSDQGANRSLQYGLVAEEVAEVAPQLIAHSANGEIETVYYQFLAPMLLNEYQRQQRMIEAQAKLLVEQTARIAMLEKQTQILAELRLQTERFARALEQMEHSKLVSATRR